jgi:hypothetical protein
LAWMCLAPTNRKEARDGLGFCKQPSEPAS